MIIIYLMLASVHNSDEGENRVNVTIPEVAQQNVDNYDTVVLVYTIQMMDKDKMGLMLLCMR